MSDAHAALSAEEILRLQALGALVDHAHNQLERGIHIDTVLLVARQHRDAGVPWKVLARALDISSRTLQRWRRRDPPGKPPLPPTVPARVPSPAPATPEDEAQPETRSVGTDISQLAKQFHHVNQTANANAITAAVSSSFTAGSSSVAAAVATPTRPRVLVLTGDPRPGENAFDPEVAIIRDRLDGTPLQSVHVAMISLGETAATIDRERSAILHLCAHCGRGGVALSFDGRTHFVAPDDVAEAIERARHVPLCAVLSFCSSTEIAARLTRRVPAVITWPGKVEDEQAACYARQLYRHIVCGTRLPEGVTEAGPAVAISWPELEPPTLQGRWRDPLV